MSMSTSIIYGSGFYLKVKNESMKKFILHHRESVEAIVKEGQMFEELMDTCMDTTLNIFDVFCEYENSISYEQGILGIIAEIMRKETNISFTYGMGDDEYGAILFPESMPWYYSEIEKKLTHDDLKKICDVYIKELENSFSFGDIRLEYYG